MPTLTYVDSLIIEQPPPEYLGAGQNSEPFTVTLEANGREESGKRMLIFGVIRYWGVFGTGKRETTFAYEIIRRSDNSLRLERIRASGWNTNI